LVSAGNSIPILRMKRASVAILSVLLIALAHAQEPKISARIDSSRYKVGQWILLHVAAELPQSVDSLVLAAKDSLGGFEILNVEKSTAQNSHQEWTLRLTMFDTGDVYIPPVPLSYRNRPDTTQRIAYSNPVAVSIVAIPFDPKGDIKDIKPPLDAPWKFEDFLPYLIALLVIGLALLAYYYYRKWKKRREEGFVPVKPSIPPGQVALTALRILEDKHLWQHGKVKQYYSEVTEIIRRFLEDQYAVLALESTSDEIIAQLMKLPEAQALLKEFRTFFTTADLVKFAKCLPTPADHENELRWGYEVVRSMIPQPAAQQPEPQEVENVR
jgi:hypothetical protein